MSKKQQPVRMVLRPREGFRDWANKPGEATVLIAPGVQGHKRKPLHEETR